MGESLIMNKTIFNFLKDFGWTQVPKNRYVTLVFDMVSIEDVLPTMSKMENVPTHVLLFTVKVVSGKGFQPIGNVFLYDNTPAWKLSDCIKAYIRDLEKCELFVIATVCPPTEYLRSVVENLVEMSTLQNKTDAHIYSVGSVNNIIHVYDAPSMLREVRNHFIKSPVTFKQFGEPCTADYKHVERTLKTTRNESLKTIADMKKDNNSEEVNKYAIRLFSMSMSRELQKAANKSKPPPSGGTANLCSFFDVLFDSFNGTPEYDNLNRRPLNSCSPHSKIWRDAIPVLKSMRFSAELAQEEEEENASLQQEKGGNLQVLTDVLLKFDAKHKLKKTKSSVQKVQGDLNLNENGEKQKKKVGFDDGGGNNEMVSSHVKQNKEKKEKVSIDRGKCDLNEDISSHVKQNKEKKEKVSIDRGKCDLNEDISSHVKQNKEKKEKASIDRGKCDLNEDISSHVKQNKEKKEKVSIDRGKRDLNEVISSHVKQNKQKEVIAADQEIGKEPSDSTQVVNSGNCSPNIIQSLNSNEKESSCAKQEEQNQIKLTNQNIGAEHSDFNHQNIQAQNPENCSLNEGTLPYVKQNKKKKIKAKVNHQQIQPQNVSRLPDEQKKTKAITEYIQSRESDDVTLNENHSIIEQGEQKKMKMTNQHVHNDGSLTESISPQIKQDKPKKTKATDQESQSISSGHCDSVEHVQAEHPDDCNLTENIASYINQKKTRIDKSDDCSLDKKIAVHVKQDTKATNPHDHLNEIPQVTKDQDTEKSTRASNTVEFETSLDSHLINKRKKVRKLSRKKRLVSDPLIEKFNNVDVYECNPSNEVHTELNDANSMLEALNDTQYLDMVLENMDKDINDASLIYENNKNSPNENREDKYKDYRKKLMSVLDQSANSTSDGNLNNSKQTLAANSEGDAISISNNANSQSTKVNNKKDYCINKLNTLENECADLNIINKRFNTACIKTNNLNAEALRKCDLLHENLLIGNFQRRNGCRRIDDYDSRLKDLEDETRPLEAPGPIFKEMSVLKMISEMVEQLKRKGLWEEITQDCSDSEKLENSTHPNCTKQVNKLEQPTCTSNEHNVVVEDEKKERTHVQSKSMKKANRKSTARKKTSKTSNNSTLKEDSSLPTQSKLKDINDEVLSNASTANSNTKEVNLRDDEQYMDVTEEFSDLAANDDGDDLSEKMQCTRPYVLDAWIISINGMKEIYKNLQRMRFQNVNTREFNVDCVKYMLHMVKQTNGVDQPCPVEKEDYQVLDKDLVEHAFLPEASITLK